MVTLALIFTMLLFAYHQLVLHFDFAPFNNLEGIPFRIRTRESLMSGMICLFTLLALRLEHRVLMLIACGMLALFSVRETRHSVNQKSFKLPQLILMTLLVLSFLFTLLSRLTN